MVVGLITTQGNQLFSFLGFGNNIKCGVEPHHSTCNISGIGQCRMELINK